MSNKFKIGDKVVLNGSRDDPLNITYIERMNKLIGIELTISYINFDNTKTYKVKECHNNYWYYEDWFDPVEPLFQLEEELFLI